MSPVEVVCSGRLKPLTPAEHFRRQVRKVWEEADRVVGAHGFGVSTHAMVSEFAVHALFRIYAYEVRRYFELTKTPRKGLRGQSIRRRYRLISDTIVELEDVENTADVLIVLNRLRTQCN